LHSADRLTAWPPNLEGGASTAPPGDGVERGEGLDHAGPRFHAGGEVSQTAVVQTLDDADEEGAEDFQLMLFNPVNATIGPSSGVGDPTDGLGVGVILASDAPTSTATPTSTPTATPTPGATPVDCDDGDPATVDYFDPGSGSCVHTPISPVGV
jgi:hypothetical protein